MFTPLAPLSVTAKPAGRLILFYEDKLVLSPGNGGGVTLPSSADTALSANEYLVIGKLNGENCAACEVAGLPEGDFLSLDMRIGLNALPEAERIAAGRARELMLWRSKRRFCGACGAALNPTGNDSGMVCADCGSLFFPVLAPAVIVAVRHEESILLAHNSRWKPGLYGLLAGFVEAGENVEQAIRREIREEVNVEVENIRYAGSQSWPFPNSLMLGFVADYAGGELRVDGEEITDAGFFTPDNMPETPPPGSIANRIISDFRNGVLI